jgi:CRP-like cAMP-binding protein
MMMPALNMVQSMLDTGNLAGSQIGTLQFAAGSRIFERGDVGDFGDFGDFAYMIGRGYVEVSDKVGGQKNVLAVLGPGEILGEISLIDGLSRSATATALHECTMIVISRQQLLEAVKSASPLARLVLTVAINRLRATQSLNVPGSEKANPKVDNESQFSAQYDAVRVDAVEQIKLHLELKTAIAKQQFELAYQPTVTLSTGARPDLKPSFAGRGRVNNVCRRTSLFRLRSKAA